MYKRLKTLLLTFTLISTLNTIYSQGHHHNQSEIVKIDYSKDAGSQAEAIVRDFFTYDKIIEKLGALMGEPIQNIEKNRDVISQKLQAFNRKFIQDYRKGVYKTEKDVENLIVKTSIKMVGEYQKLKRGELTLDAENNNSTSKDFTNNVKAANGPCLNPDMETCDFTDWDLTTGTHNGSAPFAYANPTPTTNWTTWTGSSGSEQHYIVNAASGNDANGFPMLLPDGGTCSAMLGDYTGIGALAASMRKTFLVSGNNSVFVINYAAVLENPAGHLPNEMPYFRIRVYDQNNNELSCGTVNVYSGDGQPGWNVTGSIQWKPWTTLFVPLTGYQNQNVTVEFTVGDCSLTGHYGYAYVEAACQPAMIQLAAGSTVCSDSVVVTGPPGAAAYLWNTGDTTQQITITQSGYYSVTVTPLTGANCTVTLDTNIYINTTPPVASFTHNAPQCLGRGPITFNNLSYPGDTAMPIINWLWNFGDGNIQSDNISQNQQHTYADTGYYDVSLIVTALNGCKDTISTTIYIEEAYHLFIPNVFSPNGDNVNDFFTVLTGCINELIVDIYDRWGNHVYSYNNIGGKWYGDRKNNQKADDGVYYYIVKVTDRDDITQVYTGTVTLIR